MTHPGHNGLPAVLDLLENLSQAPGVDRLARVVSSGLRRVVACDSALYQEVVPAPGESVVVSDPPGAVPADLGAALSRYRHQHPLIAHRLRTADPSPRRLSDLVSRRELHRLPVYHHVLARKGCEYQASVPLAIGHSTVVRVALIRGDRDFSERDLALLNLLQPHLVSAHQRAHTRDGIGSVEKAAKIVGEAASSRRRDLEAHGLTGREAEVLALVAEGMTNADIASDLGIAVRTVKKHLERVFSKLQVDNRTTAAATLWPPAQAPSVTAPAIARAPSVPLVNRAPGIEDEIENETNDESGAPAGRAPATENIARHGAVAVFIGDWLRETALAFTKSDSALSVLNLLDDLAALA